MDATLSMAARTGDESALNKLLQEKPFILSDNSMINSQENILNTSIKSEQIQISLKIARTSPHLLTLQDHDGVRPLDVASAYGFADVVRELLVLGPLDICRLSGKDGKTAIHHAVINGRIDVVKELMEKCPDCVKDVTSFGETVLHLAVRNYKFDVLKSLLEWLEKFGMIDEVINLKDREKNTVLHYAALRKQLESVELLLGTNCTTRNVLEVNVSNSNGLTATEIFLESSSDILLLKELLGRSKPPKKPKRWIDRVNYFRFDWHRDSPSETRSGLLVVAVLLITVAFQAGINLPSHIFPEDSSGDEIAQGIFLACNTLILSASMMIIHYLTGSMPFRREVYLANWFLFATYGCSIATARVPKYLSLPNLGIPFLLLALRRMPELTMRRRQMGGNGSTGASVVAP